MDGHAFAVQHAIREQDLQYLRHTARAVEIDRDVAARGLEVAQHRHLAPHALEIVDGPLHTGSRSDGQVMQHRVGRAAGRHHQRDRVLDRLAGDDVARLEVVLDRLDQHARRLGR